MKTVLFALACLVAFPTLAADCSGLTSKSVEVHSSPEASKVDVLRFGNVTPAGRFEGSLTSAGRTFKVIDGEVKTTGTDTCSFEFTVRTDVLPGLRYVGAGRMGATHYLVAGTYSLPPLRPSAPSVRGRTEVPRAFPFYFYTSVGDSPK